MSPGADNIELIFDYAEWVLKQFPEDGLKVSNCHSRYWKIRSFYMQTYCTGHCISDPFMHRHTTLDVTFQILYTQTQCWMLHSRSFYTQAAHWMLHFHPLQIFTEDMTEVELLPRDRVVDYLEGIAKDLVIPYLVLKWNCIFLFNLWILNNVGGGEVKKITN